MTTVIVTEENTVVVSGDATPSVTVTEAGTPQVIQVIAEGPQGPPGATGATGPTGPAGPDVSQLTRPASGAIGGQRMVIGNSDGSVSYADASTAAHLGKVLGLSFNAANNGENVAVLVFGYTEFNGWAWNTSLPIYLGTNGLLTQTPAVSGFSQIVATAETATRIYLRLREPISL